MADCKQVAGHTHQAERSRAAAHNQIADRIEVAMGLHQRLPRDQEKLLWRAGLPSWQSQ